MAAAVGSEGVCERSSGENSIMAAAVGSERVREQSAMENSMVAAAVSHEGGVRGCQCRDCQGRTS